MELFRLTRRKYADKLSGKGAAIRGGRWNSKGVHIIYTAENRSLAMAEVAVHISTGMIPDDMLMLTIHLPDSHQPQTVSQNELPEHWNQFPPSKKTCFVGDHFVHQQQSVALKVPSVVTPGDYNILLNPRHPDFQIVTIVQRESFIFDRRLF